MTTHPSKGTVLGTALAAALALAFCLSARAADGDRGAFDATPEDGILCCNGAEPFLFRAEEVLVPTGRAGIFRSEDRGSGWQRSMKGLVAGNGVSPQVLTLCQAPSQPRIVYALAGINGPASTFIGLFSSDDFGKTWTRRAAVTTGFGFNKCAVDADDPRTVYVFGVDDSDFLGKLWKSTDGGQTVRIVDANLPSSEFLDVIVVRGAVYAGPFLFPDDAIHAWFVSTDGAMTFRPQPTPLGFNISLRARPDGRAIFVETRDESFNVTGTFRSIDGGASYVAVSGLPQGFVPLAFDPSEPSRIYSSSDGLLHVSNDGGLSFTLLPASNDPRFITGIGEIGVDSRGSVYLNTLSGPFRTDDGGQTFRSLLEGFRASSVQDLTFDANGNLLVGVLHTQTVFRQSDGRTFSPIGNTPLIRVNGFGNDAASVAGSPTDPNVIMVATVGEGLFRTDNGGHSWTTPVVPGSPAGYLNSRMAFGSASRVYLVSPSQFSQPGLYRSDDAGQTFSLLSSLRFGAIAVDQTNPDVLYLGTYSSGDGLFKSVDGGQTLQNLSQPGTFSAIVVDRRSPQVVYAGQRFGQVIRSLDGGHTFAAASTGLVGAGVHGLAQDAHGSLYAWLRGGGLFASQDGATTWRPVDTDEALARSGVQGGRGTLIADPRRPGRVYLGNAGVLQVDAGDHDE